MVLVRGRCCCALWRAPNLHSNGGGSHRRGLGRIRCRSDSRIDDLTLPRVPLAGEPLESAIQRARSFLFRSYWNLRRRWDNCILPSFSKRRSAFFCSSDLGRRRRHHGHRRDSILPRAAIVATVGRCGIRDRRFVPAATLTRQKHRCCFFSLFRRCGGRFLFALKPGVENRQNHQGQKR